MLIGLGTGAIVGIVIAVIVVLILIWLASTYNGLIRKRNTCEEAFSTMDVYLKKRFDLIPNLVSTVKGYAKHESETLEKVIAARNSGATQTVEERMQDENQITGALRQIFALSENYPDLKANQNFLDLQGQLKSIEADIANARKYYNGAVKEFNNACEQVPSNIVANMFHFERKPMFEVKEEAERENVKVEF
ncbi:MAG: LemA family protein [Eubacterium sp.]|nr:LemA family protein [Eubacterium sp.]